MGNCLKSQGSDDISLLRGGNDGMHVHVQESHSDSYASPPPPYEEPRERPPIFYPTPTQGRPANQLTEEEQIRIAKRMGLIQNLPTGLYDGCKKNPECIICMVDFDVDDPVRYLPCMHIYHQTCIDDWLMRSLTCPSCMEPVDAALLTTFDVNP